MSRIRLGIHLPNGGFENFSFSYIRDLAIEAEKLGYDSIWVSDHTIWPEKLGPQNIFEPLTTLAALSSVTNQVALGISVLLPLRHPLLLANMLSTIDNAANGRLILGMGVGWFKPEFDNTSVPFNRRGEIQEEEIRLLRLLWSKPSVSFEGNHFRLKNVVVSPKPVQKPCPKILLGGRTEKTFERIVKHGDGWLAWTPSIDTFSAGVRKIKSMAEAAAKPRMTFAADFMTSVNRNSAEADVEAVKHGLGKDTNIIGNPEECAERIDQYAKQGADLVVLGFVPLGKEVESMRITAKEIMTTI